MEARRAGFLFGMVVTCLGCLWLKNIFGWVFLVLCATQSLFWGLFGWGHAIIDRQSWSRWRKTLAVASVWTGVEFNRAEHFWLDFPWLTPGHGLGVIPFVTQPLLSFVGVYGLGFVVVAGCWMVTPEDGLVQQWLSRRICFRRVGKTVVVLWFLLFTTAAPLGNVGPTLKGILEGSRRNA